MIGVSCDSSETHPLFSLDSSDTVELFSLLEPVVNQKTAYVVVT